MRLIIFKIVIFLVFFGPTKALIQVDITRGNLDPLPIAVSPLFVEKGSESYAVSKINIGEDNLIFEKTWFASIFFITYSHLFDMQYFDLRISIVTWILLAGLRAAMI